MIVRCVSEYLSNKQIKDLGPGFMRSQSFSLIKGREYVVLALDFFVKSNLFGTGAYIQYVDEIGRLGWAPLFLFEIIDPRGSQFWEVRQYEDGTLSLEPPQFYIEYFHDDLSESVPEVVEEFKRILALMENEATGKWKSPDYEES